MIGGEFAANDAHRMQEREAVRIFAPLEVGFVHEPASRAVRLSLDAEDAEEAGQIGRRQP